MLSYISSGDDGTYAVSIRVPNSNVEDVLAVDEQMRSLYSPSTGGAPDIEIGYGLKGGSEGEEVHLEFNYKQWKFKSSEGFPGTGTAVGYTENVIPC